MSTMKDLVEEHIANTFIELAKALPVKKIKVQTICDAAGISRQTFYNHFPEKFNLLTYVWIRSLGNMKVELQDFDNWVQKCTSRVKENSQLFSQLYRIPELYDWMEAWIYEQLRLFIITNYSEQAFTERIEFMLRVYVDGYSRAFQKSGYCSDLEIAQMIEKNLMNLPHEIRQFFPSAS